MPDKYGPHRVLTDAELSALRAELSNVPGSTWFMNDDVMKVLRVRYPVDYRFTEAWFYPDGSITRTGERLTRAERYARLVTGGAISPGCDTCRAYFGTAEEPPTKTGPCPPHTDRRGRGPHYTDVRFWN